MTASNDMQLTDGQKAAIEELRRRLYMDLDDKKYNDTYLFYKFLKARNFNVNNAESMLRKHLEWRKKISMDTIMDFELNEVMRGYLENSRFTFDKEGSPVHYVAFGKYDAKGIVMTTKYADLEKAVVQVLVKDERHLEKLKSQADEKLPGFVYIYDMEGLTFANATNKTALEYFVKLVKLYQDHFPERLKALYIINVSTYFTIPYNILTAFIDSNILKKFHLYGSDGYKEVLSEIIDPERLPAFLGGSLTDPDGNPNCLTKVNHAGPIDEKHYIHKSKRSLSSAQDARKLVVPRASFSEIRVHVPDPGSVIEWEFESKSRDIGFGLFLKEEGSGEEEESVTEIVPLLRLSTENFAESGLYKCEKAGNYVMLFDNSYSWMRSKEIYYRHKVISAKELEAESQ